MKSSQINVHVALPFSVQPERLFDEKFLRELGQKKCHQLNYQFVGEEVLINLLLETELSSFAAISAVGNGLDAKDGFWLHIDPVELFVDGGNICLIGRDHLNLVEEESRDLITTLNHLLNLDGLSIHYGNTHEWYLQLPQCTHIKTFSLLSVMAKDIRNFLPSGNDAKYWHKLLTELQMLLFDHQVNVARQRQQKPMINSVWVWGEGVLPSSVNLKHYEKIWSCDSYVKGLVKLSGRETSCIPTHNFQIEDLVYSGEYLIAYNHFSNDNLKEQLPVLVEGLNVGKINNLTIYLGNGSAYHWPAKRSFFRKFF